MQSKQKSNRAPEENRRHSVSPAIVHREILEHSTKAHAESAGLSGIKLRAARQASSLLAVKHEDLRLTAAFNLSCHSQLLQVGGHFDSAGFSDLAIDLVAHFHGVLVHPSQ